LDSEELKLRTKRFALQVVKLVRVLPKSQEAQVIGKQLLRSGTSVGANYRAVCRARSNPEFVAKVGVVLEEADESVFWIELLTDTGIFPRSDLHDLRDEAEQLVKIFAASRITAEKKLSHSNLKSKI
jgi:four helix bundle protein